MAGTVPQSAEQEMLSGMIACYLGAAYCRLYTTDIALGPSTVLGSLTAAEASFAGYAPVLMNSWSTTSIDAGGGAYSTTTLPKFTNTGAPTVSNLYGYYLTDSAQANWYGAERFSGAPLSLSSGVTLEVDVTYSFLTRY